MPLEPYKWQSSFFPDGALDDVSIHTNNSSTMMLQYVILRQLIDVVRKETLRSLHGGGFKGIDIYLYPTIHSFKEADNKIISSTVSNERG